MSLSTVTGRILNVTTRQLGTSLTAAATVGATLLTVDDCSAFEDDGSGGWVSINDQVIQFDTVDDDASTIHLLTGLSAAADEGDPVYSWSTLYGQIDDEQTALVQVDGDTDLADPVHADVADSVGVLPEGLRGAAGETCTLTHLSPGVWEITAVGGRSSSSRGIKFEANDQYVLTTADVTAGTAAIPLSHRPTDESLVAFYRGFPQQPSNYTINYDAQTITWPLSGFEKAGHILWVHYAYLGAVAAPSALPSYPDAVLALNPTWYYRFEAASNVDSSANNLGASNFGGASQVTGLLNSTPGLARQFDGASTGFVANVTGYSASSWGSVAVIVNPDPGQSADGILVGSMGAITAAHTFFVGIDGNGHAVVQCYGSAGIRLAGTADLRGSKHLIIATFNPTTNDVNLYVDGALAASGNNGGGLVAGSGHLSVGFNDLGPNRYYKGTMDEPAFWANGVVITPQQAADLYSAFTKGHQ